MTKADFAHQRSELARQRHKVDFDSYDVTVDELVRRVEVGRIEIAPAYQRQFRWDATRQSRLIESLLLGIPVPSLFMATNVDEKFGTSWEVVDGLQRLMTLVNFLGDGDTREAVGLIEDGNSTSIKPLKLKGLEKLVAIDNQYAKDLPTDIITGLMDRPIKVIVLNDKSDLKVRFDLFERLNTGGIKLTDQEVRESVFAGKFVDFLNELAFHEAFKTVVRLPSGKRKDGSAQEYVLRFFAFLERYESFDHSVKDFLNDFCADAAETPNLEERRQIFHQAFSFLAETFPDGLRSRMGTTPVNLFEGISVGAAQALAKNPNLQVPNDISWVKDEALRKVTTGATNNRASVRGRIDISREMFLDPA